MNAPVRGVFAMTRASTNVSITLGNIRPTLWWKVKPGRAHGIRDDDDARERATVRAWTNGRVVSSSRSSRRGVRACVGSVARDAIEFIDYN